MNQFILDDRLNCVFEQRKGAGVAAIQIWVKVGSHYELPRQAGITHFIEHLIFKGTERVKGNEMASRIESLGGSINAFTSYDNTVYHIVVPTRAFLEGLDLLTDAVVNPSFPEEEVEKEKKVVLEEIKMGEDDPQRKLYKEFLAMVYEGTPYARPVIGFEKTVSEATRDDIVAYHKSHYVPENMVVVIVGDFDAKKAKDALRKSLLVGKAATPPASPTPEGKKSKKEDTPIIIDKDVRESYCVFSYPVPLISHEDIPALDVLATILGEGESARLQQELRNKRGVVSSISSGFFFPRTGKSLLLFYATFKGNDYGPATKGFDDEIAKLSKKGVHEWEMEKAKNIIKASYVYGAETAQGRARMIGNFLTLTGNPHFVDQYVKKIDKVTGRDVRRVLDTYVSGKAKSLAALVPKNASNPHVYRLRNGMTFTINKNPASPSFSFRIGFVGGLKDEPQGKNGTFNLLSKMLLRGTREKDEASIAREIGLLAGNMSPFSGRSVFGLTGKFLSRDAEKVLTLLKELLMSTAMREKELKTAKDEVLSEIRQRDDDPSSIAFIKFYETVYGPHPYGKDPIGTEVDVERLSLKELEEAYRRYVSPENMVLALSGDLDEQSLGTIISQLFSEWKGPVNALRKEPVKPVKRELFVRKEIAQTHLIFGFLGPGVIDEERFGVEVMTAILSGMGGRIHRILREEKPYAYAVTFFNQPAYEVGTMGIYIGTDKKHAGEVEEIVKSEIERIRKEGFSEKEVADAKNRLIGNHFIKMQSNANMATNMCLDTMYGMKSGFFKEWPSRIEKVKKADVDGVARKYLNLDTMVRVGLGAE